MGMAWTCSGRKKIDGKIFGKKGKDRRTMRGWLKKTIGEICDTAGGEVKTGPFGSQLHQSDYQETGIPVVMPTDIINGQIDQSKIARVSHSHVDRLYKHKISKGEIVYGRRGDIGRQALVRTENDGWLCGTGCLRINLGNATLIPEFLHLYLKMPEIIGWIYNQAIGATMPNLNTKILRRVPVWYPKSQNEQRKIASIIFAYDDLIENNKRRIALLEKMAEEIYREWFVRMRFPEYKKSIFKKGIPKNWINIKISDIASFKYGYTESAIYESSLPKFLRVKDITLISLFEKLRFYFFDVALTPGLIQKVIANVFSSARIKKIFV